MSFWNVVWIVLVGSIWVNSLIGMLILVDDLDRKEWWKRAVDKRYKRAVEEDFSSLGIEVKVFRVIEILAFSAFRYGSKIVIWVLWLAVPLWYGIRFIEGQG